MTTTETQLPETPCAQAHNTWNPDHSEHPWLCKQQLPYVDARCPGSVLGNGDPVCPMTGTTNCDGADAKNCPAC
jgi:hypothetical protein